MVKLSQGNELINRIASKLQDMLNGSVSNIMEAHEGPNNTAVEKTTAFQNSLDPEFWDIYSIIKSINAPERDLRLEQIDVAAKHSFQWAFEKPSVGLTRWLQNDEKLFWISGKPGSGKSTFIKYLHTNPLTLKYLRNWYRSANCIQATFFFHHRGTAIQKSLEGLYRGILSQVLEQAPQALFVIQPNLSQSYAELVRTYKLGTLSTDLEALVTSCEITQDDEISRQLHNILLCEMPRKAFRTMVIEPMQASGAIDDDTNALEQIFQRRDRLQRTFSYAFNIANANNKGKKNISPSLDLYISKKLVFTQDLTDQQKRGFVRVDLLISKKSAYFTNFTRTTNKQNVFATLDLFISQTRVYTTDITIHDIGKMLAEVEIFSSESLQYSTLVGKDYFSISKSEDQGPKGNQVASMIQDWLIEKHNSSTLKQHIGV
ncbi:hypothetical protein TASIC1_0002033000 [Trichoderma asperellum]|uniref:Nephrocystin 3-like N-terminal domain-containing protein n=1 Tax=Trichoderma asperellum TaxID=101201 RepID=A0A6V8QMW1_TRIAP|nr:hypothetical protein TASIC1_0002033000 [Trichoderma asperellum]